MPKSSVYGGYESLVGRMTDFCGFPRGMGILYRLIRRWDRYRPVSEPSPAYLTWPGAFLACQARQETSDMGQHQFTASASSHVVAARQ